MATPTLAGLPTELLDEIILHTLPEGFESLALTCRRIYKLCTPFIERHNHLRSQFQKFWYMEYSRDPSLSPIRTAFDLITRIGLEPIVARYIRDADLERDCFPSRFYVPDLDRGGPVVKQLLAESPCLAQAGLDWKEYYALIEEDLKPRPSSIPYSRDRYSQHAAAFVLTLLPNVKNLRLPRLWKPTEKTEKLLDAIVRGTNQSKLLWDRPSLAQVTTFESYCSFSAGHRFDLDRAVPFLALPLVRTFRGPSSVAIGDACMPLASKDPYLRYGETLETVQLLGSCLDEVAITNFLKHTPHLRTLKYSHSTRGDPQDWNICEFVTAFEREVGACLEELSVSISDLRGSISPGKASMRGFRRLQKLEFPLEIAMCNLTDVASRVTIPNEGSTEQDLEKFEAFIGDLVPASVSQLSLLSSGTNQHEKALKVMFRDFAAKKDSQFPALKEIHLSCHVNPMPDDAYKEECTKLIAETEEAGVVLHLEEFARTIL
ncbi:F-box domain protein [Xylariaceae sp. AK1471]|nr:F-box domain protein [Xylariaceae sp. AK1471]